MTTFASLHLTDSDILESCRSTSPFAGSGYGNWLVKISEHLVVKFGVGIQRQEAENQEFARRNVNPTILYVPQVYRFFEAEFSGLIMGFIVMEYVGGNSFEGLNIIEDSTLAKRTISAIQHLATIPPPPGHGPGPVGGGSAHGYLWSDSGTGCTFRTVDDMEAWMNARLDVVKQPTISFANQQFTMHHMDLVRRNICLGPNSSICFMDWAFAGFYPRIFEIYVFRELLHTDKAWFTQLLALSQEPEADDEKVLQYLGIPAVVNNKY
jgi:hypothetical protein